MLRALELARNGHEEVSPNPLVGCVIVNNHRIIGEGWHMQYGGPHAEVNAINSVYDKSLLPESTVYVNLEPCSHYGKTPPCADLLIEKNVKEVVVANVDPNPEVAGKGLEKLRKAGIEVSEGLCSEEGEELNRRFFTYMREKRPYIILKWAQTNDGFVARNNYDSKWISNETSRKLVHKWRSEEPAILVGYQTALHDDPRLNVRDWSGKNPLRLFIDRDLSLPEHLKLFDGTQSTVCYNTVKNEKSDNLESVQIEKVEKLEEEILADLHARKIQSVIIEGGAATINRFINKGLWDEARVFVADKAFDEGIAAPVINKNIFAKEIIKGDQLLIYKNK